MAATMLWLSKEARRGVAGMVEKDQQDSASSAGRVWSIEPGSICGWSSLGMVWASGQGVSWARRRRGIQVKELGLVAGRAAKRGRHQA